MNKIFFTYIIATLLLYSINVAQAFPDTYFESSYGRLEYGFYVPQSYDSNSVYPLIMYLHGWGNNYPVYLNWYLSSIQEQNPCFVFTPRTPTDWADWSGWSYQLSEPMTAALHVLDSMLTVYSIDTNRLYVYGISMGGEGTFDLLDKLPGKFAAAMSVCGGGQPWWAENISKTPFWMFHGSADDINPPQLTERVYNELVSIGATQMRYKNYPGYGHEIWNVAQSEPSWYDWMFAHSKNDTSCSAPTDTLLLTGTIVNNRIVLSWNDIRNPDERANKIWYYKIYGKENLIGTVEFDKTDFSFAPAGTVDTFKVTGVNYHFKESSPSNIVCYDNGSLITGISEKYSSGNIINQLRDNFPNPFNPSTKISFTISNPGYVSLKVYDVLGEEICELVNEYKSTGTYKVNFDASQLSGGIYFYQIRTNKFLETKKMLLLK